MIALLLVLEGGVLLHSIGFEFAFNGTVAVALPGDEGPLFCLVLI